MSTALQQRILRVAAVAAIAALLLMLWSIFSSSPIVLVASMSVGQALGTLSFALYGLVVVFDLRGRMRGHATADVDHAPEAPQADENAGETPG